MRNYDYIKINDYYFCLQQSPVVFAWVLFFKRDDLITIQPWLKKDFPRWSKSYLKYQWNLFKKNAFNLIIFIQCRLGLRNMDKVGLPIYGHFGMHVHKGYKIFDLYNNTVTKIFDTDIEIAAIKKEIEQLKKVSQISFAPALRSWDIDKRWYQEDYIKSTIASAHRSPDSETFLKAFYMETVPCLNRLMSSEKPVKHLKEYVNELISTLKFTNTSTKELDAIEMNKINVFVNSIIDKLSTEETSAVQLVFAHGDFCPANILSTEKGIKFIDWESAGYRSLLFDFYSYFFYRPVNIKNISVEQMSSELNQVLPQIISSLDLKMMKGPASPLVAENVYRRLFYLEYLSKLVERMITDKQLNMMDYIMRYIDAFNHYEMNINREYR